MGQPHIRSRRSTRLYQNIVFEFCRYVYMLLPCMKGICFPETYHFWVKHLAIRRSALSPWATVHNWGMYSFSTSVRIEQDIGLVILPKCWRLSRFVLIPVLAPQKAVDDRDALWCLITLYVPSYMLRYIALALKVQVVRRKLEDSRELIKTQCADEAMGNLGWYIRYPRISLMSVTI